MDNTEILKIQGQNQANLQAWMRRLSMRRTSWVQIPHSPHLFVIYQFLRLDAHEITRIKSQSQTRQHLI